MVNKSIYDNSINYKLLRYRTYPETPECIDKGTYVPNFSDQIDIYTDSVGIGVNSVPYYYSYLNYSSTNNPYMGAYSLVCLSDFLIMLIFQW